MIRANSWGAWDKVWGRTEPCFSLIPPVQEGPERLDDIQWQEAINGAEVDDRENVPGDLNDA